MKFPKLLIAALLVSALAVVAITLPLSPGLMLAFAFRGSVATAAILLAAIFLMKEDSE